MTNTNFQVEYHRNGVSGTPFHVVLFDCADQGEVQHLVGVVFPNNTKEDKNFPRTAVFDTEKLAAGEIGFGRNSFRGDRFDADLRSAISSYEDSRS